MNINILTFTENGIRLAESLKQRLEEQSIQVVITTKYENALTDSRAKEYYTTDSIYDWAAKAFATKQPLLFIGSTGIAIRAIAPSVKDKLSDSPVLVMDEQGTFVISLLSGHVGGANEIAKQIAQMVEAVPVITTATDLNDAFSVDLFAKEQSLAIANRDAIKRVSTKALADKPIRISVEHFPPQMGEDGKPLADVIITDSDSCKEQDWYKDGATIVLTPKKYAVGIGCKKGKTREEIETLLEKVLNTSEIQVSEIGCLASIDIKGEEAGILELSEKYRIPFVTFDAEILKQITGEFTTSEFVKSQVGVDNVCERAAIAACGADGELVVYKTAENGVTIAIARR